MKRIAVLGLCLCLFPCCAMASAAENTSSDVRTDGAIVSASVPYTHTIRVIANTDVAVNGTTGTEFTVERLSEPTVSVALNGGEVIMAASLNGQDILNSFVNGQYTLAPVYEDQLLEIEIRSSDEPSSSESDDPQQSAADSSSADTSSDNSAAAETADSSSAGSTESTSASSDAGNQSAGSQNAGTAGNTGGSGGTGSTTVADNGDSPKTGDILTIGVSAVFLAMAFVMILLKKRDRDRDI